MTTIPKLWKPQTQVNTTDDNRSQFDSQIAAVNPRILNGRRASLLSTVAVRLWAAASICLATYGATAAESATVLSPICSAADRRLITLIEAHGEAQDVAVQTLAQAFFQRDGSTQGLQSRAGRSGDQALKAFHSAP